MTTTKGGGFNDYNKFQILYPEFQKGGKVPTPFSDFRSLFETELKHCFRTEKIVVTTYLQIYTSLIVTDKLPFHFQI